MAGLAAAMPLAAVATGASYDQQLSTLTPITAVLALVLSTLSGAAALTYKMMRAADIGKPIRHPGLFATANLLGSMVAGVLAVIVAKSNDRSVWEALSAVIVSAWIGAVGLDVAARLWLQRLTGSKGEK